VTVKLSINSKTCTIFTTDVQISAVCSDTSSRSESTGRRSGLWRSCRAHCRLFWLQQQTA